MSAYPDHAHRPRRDGERQCRGNRRQQPHDAERDSKDLQRRVMPSQLLFVSHGSCSCQFLLEAQPFTLQICVLLGPTQQLHVARLRDGGILDNPRCGGSIRLCAHVRLHFHGEDLADTKDVRESSSTRANPHRPRERGKLYEPGSAIRSHSHFSHGMLVAMCSYTCRQPPGTCIAAIAN